MRYRGLVVMMFVLICSVSWAMPTNKEEQIAKEEWDRVVKKASVENVVQKSVLKRVNEKKDENKTEKFSGVLNARVSLAGDSRLFDALRQVAEACQKTLVLGAGVQDQEIRLDLKDMESWRALDIMLYPYGYGFSVDGKTLVVLARETRMFRLSLPPVEQTLGNVTTNESLSGAAENGVNESGDRNSGGRMRVGAKVVLENKSEKLSFWADVEGNVKTLLSVDGRVSFNRVAGVMVVTDAPQALERIAGFVKEMDERMSRRLLVDVKVIEVTLSDKHRLGIDWGVLMNRGDLKAFRASNSLASENISAGNFMTLSGNIPSAMSGETVNGVSVLLRALDDFGRVEVVSQPRVVMLNNTVANIQVGQTRSYIESTTVETTTSGSTVSGATLNEVHGGVTLQIVGNISGEDVFLNVTPVVSTVDDIRTITLGNGAKLEAPETSMKSINTFVRLKQGETVVLGGLITRNHAKYTSRVPFLSRLPVIGKLFSYEGVDRRRTELVVLMTPRKG